MTTIAWDGTTLAADTRCVFGGVPVRVSKLWRVGDIAYAATGDMAESVLVARWVEAGMPDASRPRCEEAGRSGILVKLSTGEAWRLIGRTGLVQIPIHEPFEAMGSGCDYATAAMAMGKTAVQAVKFAMRFDVFTGGPVESVRVKKRRT